MANPAALGRLQLLLTGLSDENLRSVITLAWFSFGLVGYSYGLARFSHGFS